METKRSFKGRVKARECPICGADTYVYHTKEKEDGRVRRWRCCPVCRARYQTVEQFDVFVKQGSET